MSTLPSEMILLSACAAALPIMIRWPVAPARSQRDAEVESLLAKIDAARGRPVEPQPSLTIEGRFALSFEGAPDVLEGSFREIFGDDGRARHEADLGDQGKIERGNDGVRVWEIDPTAGAKLYAEPPAETLRRYFALLRGASPRRLYPSIARDGTEKLDGREHTRLRMSPAHGKPDTWFVDPQSGLVSRIDITLPVPEGAQAVWAMPPEIETHLLLDDWRPVGGVQQAHRRTVTMGLMTFTFTCTKIESGGPIDPARFTPPDAVLELKGNPGAPPKEGDSSPSYQIVDRQAQSVASIRVQCKLSEVSATLARVLPEVMAHLNASGAKMTGAPFSRYHDVRGDDVELECGIPVAKPVPEQGRVKNGDLPGGKAVMTWHVGPYEKLDAARRSLRAYVEANHLKPRGGLWEIYWTDPGIVPDPAKWRTQLFVPIDESAR